MALLEFVATMAFVAVVALALMAVTDIFVPRRLTVWWIQRSHESFRARKRCDRNT